MSLQEKVNDAFEGSDVAGSDRVGEPQDGLQSGDVSGSLGAEETSVLRAQEQQAAEEDNLAELAKERLGDPTATMDDGTATATSPDSLESDVVDVSRDDLEEAAADVAESEGGEFRDGTTVRATGMPNSGSSETHSGNWRTIDIRGSGPRAAYSFEVSGDLRGTSSLTGEDSVQGSTASGAVSGGSDDYKFRGSLENLSVDNTATVFVDGERYGSSGPSSSWVPSPDFGAIGTHGLALVAVAVVGLIALVAGWLS